MNEDSAMKQTADFSSIFDDMETRINDFLNLENINAVIGEDLHSSLNESFKRPAVHLKVYG